MTEHRRPSPPATSIPQRHHSVKGLQRRGTYGTENHLVFHEDFQEEWKPLRVRELIRPLTVRQVSHTFWFFVVFKLNCQRLLTDVVQWIEGGKIHREPISRETPRFELFFDLLFVAIIHQLADAAIGQFRVVESQELCCLTVHRGAWRSFCSSIHPHLLAKASFSFNLTTEPLAS